MHNTFIKKNITIIAFCTLFSTATSPSWGKSTPAAVLQTVKSFLSKDMGKKALKIGLPAGGFAILAGLTGYGVKKVMQRRRREEEGRTAQKESQQKLEKDRLSLAEHIEKLKKDPSSFKLSETPFVQNLSAIKKELDEKKSILKFLKEHVPYYGQGTNPLLKNLEEKITDFSNSDTGIKKLVQEFNSMQPFFVDFFCALGAERMHVQQKFDEVTEKLQNRKDSTSAQSIILKIYYFFAKLHFLLHYYNKNIVLIEKNVKRNWSEENDRNNTILGIEPDLLSWFNDVQELLGFKTLGDISKIDASQEAKGFFAFIFTLLYVLAKNSKDSEVKGFMQNVHSLEEFKKWPIQTILYSGLIL